MKTYTIHAQDRNSGWRVPLRRANETKDEVMQAGCHVSIWSAICDVVITQGSRHIATFRNGNMTHLNGKECKA